MRVTLLDGRVFNTLGNNEANALRLLCEGMSNLAIREFLKTEDVNLAGVIGKSGGKVHRLEASLVTLPNGVQRLTNFFSTCGARRATSGLSLIQPGAITCKKCGSR